MGFVAQNQSVELVASRHDGCGRGMVTSGIAIIVAAPLVAGLVGAIGFAIGVYFALFEANGYNLDFSAARLSGLIAGMVVSIILGGYVSITLPLLFVGGFAWLLFSVMRLLIIEVVS